VVKTLESYLKKEGSIPSSVKMLISHYRCCLGETQSLLLFGSYGIKAITGGHISEKQIEAARRVLSRVIKKEGGKIWIRIFPIFPKTKKFNARMGMGKGTIDSWYANVKANQILFEFTELDKSIALQVTRIVSSKLSIKVKLYT
jgi:large subunit ribosomal protein L16